MSSAQSYQMLSEIEHILKRSGMYIGNTETTTKEKYVIENDSLVKKTVTYNPAVVKMVDEVLSNCADEHKREGSQLNKVSIEISIDGTITIKDNGGIPVEIHPDVGVYIPEMIFTMLRTSSNYNDEEDRTMTGTNGVGVKLVSIFSTYFKISTIKDGKSFSMEVKNNLSEKSKPSIRTNVKGQNSTTIIFKPDYERLGAEMCQDLRMLIVKKAYDLSACNPDISVTFNDTKLKVRTFEDYIKLYTSEYAYDQYNDWQIGIASSDDGFQQISFVNNSETDVGGFHIYYVS
jgi:DNA topoisomerase-2